MEEIISDLEDFEGKALFDYSIIFHSIDKKQRDYLIAHFQDYSWDMGTKKIEIYSDNEWKNLKDTKIL
ncbi:hypothetical protein N9D82_02290 [Gammaproteobacteria bacterium]|nr:hypothetical protein [Gammaproteobacteria bacterium]